MIALMPLPYWTTGVRVQRSAVLNGSGKGCTAFYWNLGKFTKKWNVTYSIFPTRFPEQENELPRVISYLGLLVPTKMIVLRATRWCRFVTSTAVAIAKEPNRMKPVFWNQKKALPIFHIKFDAL